MRKTFVFLVGAAVGGISVFAILQQPAAHKHFNEDGFDACVAMRRGSVESCEAADRYLARHPDAT